MLVFLLELFLRITGCYKILRAVAKSFSHFILSYMKFLFCWILFSYIYIYCYSICEIIFCWISNEYMVLKYKWLFVILKVSELLHDFSIDYEIVLHEYWLCKMTLTRLQVNIWLYLSYFKTMLYLLLGNRADPGCKPLLHTNKRPTVLALSETTC